MVSALAKELEHLAAGHISNSMFREPRWTTPNRIALELPSMRLREFSADGDDIATLICAPLALHDATLTDFAPNHSLVAALRMAGLRNVFVTDWRSASPEMRFFSIDSYLADLNVVVDELGSFSGSLKPISLQLAGSQHSDARLISRSYVAQSSCSLPATTRSLLPNSCWPPDILLAASGVKSGRRSWRARTSGCSWEQPPSYILGPRSRAGSRRPEWLCRTSCRS